MGKIVKDNEKLRKIGTNKGYKFYNSPFKTHSVNQTRKTITVWCQIDNDENIYLAHELGHIYFWRIERIFRIINEIIAWIIGYIILKSNKVDTKNFNEIMVKCLKSYIKVK